jgi:ATP:ADP antiporter, AAA family
MLQFLKSLWPVQRSEWGRFLPTFLLGFFICFNYYLLRPIKDTVVVTMSDSGAGVIPFLKLWAVLPAVVGAALLISLLYRKLSRPTVFYLGTTAFLLFFVSFALFLYPMREALALDSLASFLYPRLPAGFAAPIELIRQWPLSLFYVVCELWKVVVLMVLFWGYVNSRTDVSEAQRLYAPLMVGGSLSGWLAGEITISTGGGEWNSMLTLLIFLVSAVGVACLALFAWTHRAHGKEKGRTPATTDPIPDAYKPRTAMEALRLVFRSRILLCIAVVIIAEYVAFNLVEVLWKEQMHRLYPDPATYCAYTGRVLRWTGILGIFASLFISGGVIRRFGWLAITLFTPAILALTSAAFFICLFLSPDSVAAQAAVAAVGVAPMTLAVFFGAVHNCTCRASRQAFADPAKEIAYLPLSSDLQTQGKTFVDGVSPTIGKTGGALIQQGLLIGVPDIMATAPFAAGLVFLSIGLATTAVFAVGRPFRQQLGAA